MIINTKFNLGQRVWLMYENAPFEVEIVEIIPAEFRLNNAGIPTAKTTHKYGIKRIKPPIDPYDGYGKQLPTVEWEYKLFASKRELCLSFLKEDE